MTQLHFLGADGESVPVSATNPLPMAGGAGGGMTPEDITATAPLSWDSETATMSANLTAYATTSALTSGLNGKANTSHTHTTAQVTGLDTQLSQLNRVADYVDPAAGTIADVIAALVAAGLMASE